MPDSRIPDFVAVSSPQRCDLSYGEIRDGDRIGKGGNAIVSRCDLSESDSDSLDTIALKQPLQSPETISRNEIERFLEKGKTWRRLDTIERTKHVFEQSEHIVGIVDTGNQLPWIAMEYMDGGGLDNRLEENPNGLPVDEALWIGECLCQGLEVAHSRGVAHLDLKPANVLFRTTGDGTWDVPKIADWGLSRLLIEDSGQMEMLSAEYTTPEQFDADQFGDPDLYTDIYQLGGVIYAMLTGDPPYTGGQASVLHDVVYGEDPTPPSEIRDELPPKVDSVILSALAQEKADRYSSAGQFAEALQSIQLESQRSSPATKAQSATEPQSTGRPSDPDLDICVVGCGGAGSFVVNRCTQKCKWTRLVATDTDVQTLVNIEADSKILIGQEKTQGKGAGSLPQVGEEAALESREEIYDAIEGSDVVFVVAGLGGGTGTGGSPVIAQCARDVGALTIGIVTTPFDAEGELRRTNAKAGIEQLRATTDALLVTPLDRMLDEFSNMAPGQAYKKIDDLLMRSITETSALLSSSQLVHNQESQGFEYLRMLFETGDTISIAVGEVDSGSSAEDLVMDTLEDPLFDSDLSEARTVVVHVSAGQSAGFPSVDTIFEQVDKRISPGTRLVRPAGVSVTDRLEDTVRMTIVATAPESMETNEDYTEYTEESSGSWPEYTEESSGSWPNDT